MKKVLPVTYLKHASKTKNSCKLYHATLEYGHATFNLYTKRELDWLCVHYDISFKEFQPITRLEI